MKYTIETLDHIRSYKMLLRLSIGCVVTFFLWAYFAQVEQQVRATGQVVPSGKARMIQHLEGGIVNDIKIKEGQKVEAGDILFNIENSRAESDMEELRVALDALEIRRVRLEAEYQWQDKVNFPAEAIENYKGIVDSERRIFESRNAEISEVTKGLEKRISQKILKLDELTSTVRKLDKELEISKTQLKINTGLREKGAVSRSQYLDTVSTVRNFETRINRTEKEIPIVKSEIAEITNAIEEKRQGHLTMIGEELNEAKVDTRKLTERIRSFSDQVSRTAVRSPVDGIISEVLFNTIGAVVQPGGFLTEIIPVNENLIIEGRVFTNNRGDIWPGQKAIVKITAYDYSIYGGIDGELTYISANSFTDNQNRQYYQIEIELEAVNLGEEFPLFAGMSAEVSLMSGKISILHALLKPFHNITDNALREP